jgi:aspartyl-tRNA(Asn)/glutamyl-tRNA(Gln) amidotransferase subunit A
VRLPILERYRWSRPTLPRRRSLVPYLLPFVIGHEADLHPIASAFISAPQPSLADYVAAEANVEKLKSAFAA